MRMTDNDITILAEEIGMDGEVALATKNRSTAKRTVRRVNEYLAFEQCEWEVELTVDKECQFPYGIKIK